ncbi:NAD(P)H-hydrate dehydratase [Flavobacterium cerinum]|uniref:Bifunctional NAD(P)H-hydrate repair enzyme n=1 Tax=Flavobacterium cerinum TaxID=2502784 RepID=A0A3S3R131_9FLAO|nr:NAD(P)H-hydrate dehydratase [Flavobacterium cerinum]RWX01503.1 NAD(P)H-hydrate dehydratase [Flavobacterium cerinum]
MKIFNAVQIRQADEMTVTKQNITYNDLMERAGREVFLWLKMQFPDKETIFHFFCGQGNNGGDGLAAARLLQTDNYKVVLDIIEDAGKPTPAFTANLKKIEEAGIQSNQNTVYEYEKGRLVYIDALFGIGLTRDLNDAIKQAIENINNREAIIVSIDVPSGMFMDRKTDIAVRSDVVLTFQFPKLALYLPGNASFVKEVAVLDIGLDNEFIKNTVTDFYFTDEFEAQSRYKPVTHNAHKGTQGHALIIGGSYGKIGAICLSAKAALKSGCGLATAYLPKCGYTVLQTSFPEAMVLTNGEEHITQISFDFQPKAIGIGMGLGQHQETQKALYDFLKIVSVPLVIDADALNILSYNKEWLKLLPENTILTPHPKELERLMGSWKDDFEKIEMMKSFSKEYKLVLIAKDAYTMIVYNGTVHINSSGNAALATGGSGDVLTGIITGLLAQSYSPVDAAIFGVYLHGLTADIGIRETAKQVFIASDILKYMGKAYMDIEAKCNLK